MYSENVIYLFKTFYLLVFNKNYVKCGFKAAEPPDLLLSQAFFGETCTWVYQTESFTFWKW